MKQRGTLRQSLLTPIVMMLLAASAVTLLWTALRKDHESRVADIVEAVSYAARSEMARQLIVQFRAFEQVRDFWTEFASIPTDQWRADAMIEIEHFPGLDMLAWAERDGPRFFASGSSIALDHVPSDEEWALISDAIDAAFGVAENTFVEPVRDNDGHAIMRLYLPVREPDRNAVLVAVIDTTEQIAALLEDDSPGYDIQVTCCEGFELYRAGRFDADVPASWIHSGRIEPIGGVLWRVEHRPSTTLTSDFRPWALNTVLIVGLALALAIGAIAYHSRRADERASAARLAERQIRVLNRNLEDRVKHRTRELDDALSDLNTINLSVAHDVRSPLNAASLTLETLRSSIGENRQVTAQLDRVRSGLDQITTILDRLLALSRASSFETRIESVDITKLALQVGTELDSEGKYQLEVAKMPAAALDPTMAHILLTNLISNAIRHSAAENDRRIEVGARTDNGRTVYFVRDHGRGIDPAAAESLFRPAQRNLPDGHGGLGLGLAIAARVIARHGGRIWVEQTDGGGASFCFSLSDQAESATAGA